VFEVDSETLIVSIFAENGFWKINRITGSVTALKKSIGLNSENMESMEEDEMNNQFCTDLKPLPGFNAKSFPFMITRT